ncbi:hypothetical protein D3C79_646920 [compost metagenome]
MEARVIQETADGIRADIQAIDIVTIFAQQAFGEMVTDKAVNAQDQHAGPALHHRAWLGSQTYVAHHAHFRCQAVALHIQTRLALASYDFQRPFTTGNHQWSGAQHRARLLIMRGIQHACAPNDHLALAQIAEGARIRFGDGTHQVVDFMSRLVPLDLTVGSSTAAKIAGIRFVLLS